MRVTCFLTFFLGILFGVGGFAWVQVGGIASPAQQDTTRIEVSIAQLKPRDQWLDKIHFQIVPLYEVRSVHQYFIILMTPPAGGIQGPANVNTEIYLTSSTDLDIQPFEINRVEFGSRGDQPVLKLIEGGISIGHNPHLQISSSSF